MAPGAVDVLPVAHFTELGRMVSSLRGHTGLGPCVLPLWQAVITHMRSLMDSRFQEHNFTVR